MNKIITIIFSAILIFLLYRVVEGQNTHSMDFEADTPDAISFNDDDASSALIPGTRDWTVMAWIKLESFHGTDRQIIYIDEEGGAGADSTIQMDIAGGTKSLSCRFRLENGSEASAVSPTNSVAQLGRWYHVACERDAGNSLVRAFVYGRQAATASLAGGLIDARGQTINPCLGSLFGTSCGVGTVEVFDGIIDEFSMWSRALPEAEIQQRMRQELNATASTTATQALELYMKLDNNLTDSVGRTTQLGAARVGTPTHRTDTGWKQFIEDEF